MNEPMRPRANSSGTSPHLLNELLSGYKHIKTSKSESGLIKMKRKNDSKSYMKNPSFCKGCLKNVIEAIQALMRKLVFHFGPECVLLILNCIQLHQLYRMD